MKGTEQRIEDRRQCLELTLLRRAQAEQHPGVTGLGEDIEAVATGLVPAPLPQDRAHERSVGRQLMLGVEAGRGQGEDQIRVTQHRLDIPAHHAVAPALDERRVQHVHQRHRPSADLHRRLESRAHHAVDDQDIGIEVLDLSADVDARARPVQKPGDLVPPFVLGSGGRPEGSRVVAAELDTDLCRARCHRRPAEDSGLVTASSQPLGQVQGWRYVAATVPGGDQEPSRPIEDQP